MSVLKKLDNDFYTNLLINSLKMQHNIKNPHRSVSIGDGCSLEGRGAGGSGSD